MDNQIKQEASTKKDVGKPTSIHLTVPMGFYEEKWVQDNAFMFSNCCRALIVWNDGIPMCSDCEQECTVIN